MVFKIYKNWCINNFMVSDLYKNRCINNFMVYEICIECGLNQPENLLSLMMFSPKKY